MALLVFLSNPSGVDRAHGKGHRGWEKMFVMLCNVRTHTHIHARTHNTPKDTLVDIDLQCDCNTQVLHFGGNIILCQLPYNMDGNQHIHNRLC